MIAAFMLLAVAAVPPAADPLTARLHTEDADRFVALFERTHSAPTAAELQRDYLDPGSYGITVFTKDRIVSAEHLAATIAAKRALYETAIRTCLPVARETNDELRSIYLALHGLLPEKPLPQVYLVLRADSSGGTAGEGAQVLGLETLCALNPAPDMLRATFRSFYAHETVHTFQKDAPPGTDPLLESILLEGAADFIARIVTGQQMRPDHAEWALPREAELSRQLDADLAAMRGKAWADVKRGTPDYDRLHRWVNNYGHAPAGWPVEIGYWMGQRIWERWYALQPDKAAAIRAMLRLEHPDTILAAGRFRP